jgi:4,5:9,10-diseco-3-hydroxy-5,9,17-trioxoandrosta-1(10),2-diene-4-oate hydrolase
MIPTFNDQFITLHGLRLRYWQAGATGSPILLLHGLMGSIENWRWIMGALAEQHCVFAFDGPGHGLSQWDERAHELSFMSDLVTAFMQAHDLERATIVGHSGGGLAALTTALESPQLLDKLVLASSGGLGYGLTARLKLASIAPVPPLILRMGQASLPLIRSYVSRYLFYNPRAFSDAVFSDVTTNIRRNNNLFHATQLVRQGINVWGQKMVFTPRLSQLTVPTLIIWGKQDRTIPVRHAYRAARLIPQAQLVVLDRCRHMPMIEYPAEFSGYVLEFLRSASLVIHSSSNTAKRALEV